MEINFPNLGEADTKEAHKYVTAFLAGEMSLMALPAWVLSGKRCATIDSMGPCNEAVFGDQKYCCACNANRRRMGVIGPRPGRNSSPFVKNRRCHEEKCEY